MAWGNTLSANNAVETPAPIPAFAFPQFPPLMFDATKFPPANASEIEAERLAELESAGKDELTRHMELIKQSLVSIIGNRFMNESARVAASRLLFDICESEAADKGMKAEIAVAAEKAARAGASALTPSKRRGRKANDEVNIASQIA